jgi:hypothetical protein
MAGDLAVATLAGEVREQGGGSVIVRTPCPTCNVEVDVASEGILLLIQEDDQEGRYVFECPLCLTVQDKPADQRMARLLISAGVPRGDSP